MSMIASIGYSLPENELLQSEARPFIESLFSKSRDISRLLPVFDHAAVHKRQFVMPIQWYTEPHGFHERNTIYEQKAAEHGLKAIDQCLHNDSMLASAIPYDEVDMVIYISSTGIATPTMDARFMNERPFRDDVKRLPVWGLGCAGGGAAFARAYDYVQSYPNENVLIVCVELCSLTFLKDDHRKSNIIGTALFGDGIAAALVIGSNSNIRSMVKKPAPTITATSSKLLQDSLDVMGWNTIDEGFQVVFAKSIPHIVETFWKEHVQCFEQKYKLNTKEMPFFVAHPGGKKVLEAYASTLHCSSTALRCSYDVLREHGNMSSATVLHVLKKYMEENHPVGTKSMLAALGPGFSSELLHLEWA
ncbi:type III polyketide synthase [Pontibacillus litoralis]|uniref:Chalcone synthase n=1 Tax=Pontibacillus litoralis JSM 072002 TaxID=1385512 RepID=A0A0A5G9W6_9BACI|nr:3-oxoacyl-[acyl-carrier-protein] synthase III C-terminal domain-containing protein [Pontibacillus litoralis]KGX87915.1 chalcone synthase [Pontibacillus litoralis JSM 072002]